MLHSDFSNLFWAIYARKSTENEDRQVLSVQSQIAEMQEVAQSKGIGTPHIFTDQASAHYPDNRPGFKKLLDKIRTGEIHGVLVWKPDRLSRNMQEGGMLINLLQCSVLQCIVTPHTLYSPNDNTLPLVIEFGMANQYSLDLSKNVKRGNKAKIAQGGKTGLAPLGYLNDKVNKTVYPDPERFEPLKQMWQSYLTGNYSLRGICEMAEGKWSFRTRVFKRKMAKPLCPQSLHKIFTNPFYCGVVKCGDYINHQGVHEPMVTREEFEKVQALLHRHGHDTTLRSHDVLLFQGFLRCGHCERAITGEEKLKYWCQKCGISQTAKKPRPCRKCSKPISERWVRNARRYYLYRCHSSIKCPNSLSLSESELIEFFEKFLARVTLDEPFLDWGVDMLKVLISETRSEQKRTGLQSNQKREQLETRKTTLLDLRLNNEIGEETFRLEQQSIDAQLHGIRQSPTVRSIEAIMKQLREDFSLMVEVGTRWKKESVSGRRRLLRELVSNPEIKDRQPAFQLQKPYSLIHNVHLGVKRDFEPGHFPSVSELAGSCDVACQNWRWGLDRLRTWYMENHG